MHDIGEGAIPHEEFRWVFFILGHEPVGGSVLHGQCDARPTVTFLAAGHHRLLTGTKLYCLVTEEHECEQLAQGC